jgi:hypothetical protein
MFIGVAVFENDEHYLYNPWLTQLRLHLDYVRPHGMCNLAHSFDRYFLTRYLHTSLIQRFPNCTWLPLSLIK